MNQKFLLLAVLSLLMVFTFHQTTLLYQKAESSEGLNKIQPIENIHVNKQIEQLQQQLKSEISELKLTFQRLQYELNVLRNSEKTKLDKLEFALKTDIYMESEKQTAKLALHDIQEPIEIREDLCKSPYLSSPNILQRVINRTEKFLSSMSYIDDHIKYPRFEWKDFDLGLGISYPIVCKKMHRFGYFDDEKRLCYSRHQNNRNCTIFSIGSKNQFDFEVEMFRATRCTIHTFDCTLKDDKFYPPAEIKSRAFQYPYCISDVRKGKFLPLEDLFEIAKVRSITFLKMDVEGHEWVVFNQLIKRGQELYKTKGIDTFPDQIAVEIHSGTRRSIFIKCLFAKLYYEAGYVVASRKGNPLCHFCEEVLLVRVRCGTFYPSPLECSQYYPA